MQIESLPPQQDTPSGRTKHAGPFSEAAADSLGDVSVSDGTPAHATRPGVPHSTPAEGLIPLKEAMLRSEGTDSESGSDDDMPSGDGQGKAESLVSSHSSAAVEGIRSTLVALARGNESQASLHLTSPYSS